MGTETAVDIRAKEVQVATKTGYKVMRSSDATMIDDIDRRNREWLTSLSGQRDRMRTNMRMYVPVDGSSWDDESYKAVTGDGRHAVSFDIASRKIDTLAGAIRAEKWDFDFQALNMAESPVLKKIKHLYMADKEQYNYSNSEAKCLLRGLLHSGYEEMAIDYDIRPTGGISFICPQAGTVLKDPYWVSDELRDWKRAIKHSWFTAEEIMQKWEVRDPFIAQQAEADRLGGERYGSLSNVDEFVGVPQRWGSKYLVIEYRWIEEKKTTRLYGKTDDGEWVEFPLDVESRSEVQEFMQSQGIVSWNTIRELPYTHRTLKLCVCSPSLTKTQMFYNGDHDVQCGFIGFFPFSACHEMGVDKGIMDAAIDVQRTLNYRECKKDDIMASLAADVNVVNLDALDNGRESLREINENITKPGYTIGVHGNPSQQFYKPGHGAVPPDIWRDIDQMVNMFDRVIPVTPALEGTGTSEESGVLFEMRHAVSKLGTMLLYDNWRQHLLNKAEAWYNQALITYKDIQRNVIDSETNEQFEFNKPVYMVEGSDVKRAYLNHIGDLPRARVFIGLRKDSPTQRMADRAMLYDVTKILSAHPDLFRNEIRILTNQILKTIELEPDQKRQVEHVAKLQEIRDVMAIAAEMENIKAGDLNAKVMQQQAMGMLKQLAAQMTQQGGGAPGGAPGGGGGGPAGGGGGEPGPQDQMSRPVPMPASEDLKASPEQQFQQVPVEETGGIPTPTA